MSRTRPIPVNPDRWAEMVHALSEVTRLRAERIHDLNQIGGLQEENARLQAEVERLRFAEDLLKDENQHLREEEPLPDGWNSAVAKACDILAEKDKENARLQAEVERLRKAGDELERVLVSRSGSYEAGNASHEWQSAKNYKPSV